MDNTVSYLPLEMLCSGIGKTLTPSHTRLPSEVPGGQPAGGLKRGRPDHSMQGSIFINIEQWNENQDERCIKNSVHPLFRSLQMLHRFIVHTALFCPA
jgi:hypothetical protein